MRRRRVCDWRARRSRALPQRRPLWKRLASRLTAMALADRPSILSPCPKSRLRHWATCGPSYDRLDSDTARRVEFDAKYAVYLDRQIADIERHRRDELLLIPAGLDFATMAGLSNEMRAKFTLLRPQTLAQASRIEGVTPAALALVAAHARKRRDQIRGEGATG